MTSQVLLQHGQWAIRVEYCGHCSNWSDKTGRAVTLWRNANSHYGRGHHVKCWHLTPLFGRKLEPAQAVVLALAEIQRAELAEAQEKLELDSLADFARDVARDHLLTEAE